MPAHFKVVWYNEKKRGFGDQRYLGSNSTSIILGELLLLNYKNDHLKVILKAMLQMENHKGKVEQICLCKNLKRKKSSIEILKMKVKGKWKLGINIHHPH